MRRLTITALAALLAAPAVAQGGAPTKADIAPLLMSNRDDLTINFIQIGPPHRASVYEASHIEADLGQPIYPVHAAYTSHNGIYVRDTDSHWYAFRSRIKRGAWDISSWSVPGDKLDELRP